MFPSPRLILGYATGSTATLLACTGPYSGLGYLAPGSSRAQMPRSRMTFGRVLRTYNLSTCGELREMVQCRRIGHGVPAAA